MESADSDYDVRFVYARPLEEYLQVSKRGEVITKTYDKEGRPAAAQGCFLDFCGFDIFKFARMLSKSNPTTIEWLVSDILYIGEKPGGFVDFALNCFNPVSLYHHYKSMCRQNYLKYLKSGNLVTYKKYLYAMRGLVNAKWVASRSTVPQIDFTETLNRIKQRPHIVPEPILTRLFQIIRLKKQGKEKDIIENEAKIDEYVERFLKDDSDAPENKKHATLNALNTEILKTVMKGSGTTQKTETAG